MENLELCHFGDQCAPGIIMDDILNIRKKHLFMLGIFKFNDILKFLKENNYEKIYDRKYLVAQSKKDVIHTSYNFIFNHDYIVENSNFTNYNVIKERFDIKIKHFREMLASQKKAVFINFNNSVDASDITGMLNWLQNNKKNFHLIIFTDKNYSFTHTSPNLSIIKLQNKFNGWWEMNDQQKTVLYKEIYEKFIGCLLNANIENNCHKLYNETEYGKAHPS